MAINDRKRQQQLARKRQKDKIRRNKAKGAHLAVPPDYYVKKSIVKRAGEFPLHQCLIVPDWQKTGLARILVARKQPDNKITFGIFLVDVFCMGLKNTFWNANFPADEYHDSVETKIFQEDVPKPCDIGLARKIVYGAIDYAKKLGFTPDKDFELTENILGKPTEADMGIEVTFGKDGRPFYLAGPDDNTAYVLKTLRQSVGDGNFEYILDMDKVAEFLGD